MTQKHPEADQSASLDGPNPVPVRVIRWILAIGAITGLVSANWSLAFVSTVTFFLTLLPRYIAGWLAIRLPGSFLVAITLFIFGTIFLGEAFDFYERYWWWDVVLHGGSAMGFGLIGFLFVFMLFEGDRFAAPPTAIAFMAFATAVTIGAVWEIFEFAMDQLFGLNMQKSGLVDTMWDLIVDCVGASIGAFAGYVHLRGREMGGLTALIRAFIAQNRSLFSRSDQD